MSKPRFQVGDRVRWAYWGLVGSWHFTGTVVRAGTFEGGATDGAYGCVVKVDGEKADDGRDVGVFLKESDLHPLERDADADRA
jgi:hypothetical protein